MASPKARYGRIALLISLTAFLLIAGCTKGNDSTQEKILDKPFIINSENPITPNSDHQNTPLHQPRDNKQSIAEKTQCDIDQDCAPASCCHPSQCVLAHLKPACRDTLCTQECQPQTMDCGGRCACLQHECIAMQADEASS